MDDRRQLKICYVDESSAIGGAEAYLKMLSEHFAPHYDVNIIHLGDEMHRNYYDAPRVTHIPCLAANRSGLVTMSRYYSILRQLAPDVLHVNQPAPDRCFHAIVAGRLASVRLVMSTCHLPGAVFRRSFLGMAAGKSLYDHAVNTVVFNCLDKIIVVSESGIEGLNKNYPISSGKSVCVHNGVDCEKYRRCGPSASSTVRASLNIPEDVLLLASVGRLHEQKDYASLLKAFSCAHKRHPRLNLIIVGEGELRQELEQLAVDLGLERVTHLVGQRSNIPEILAACDIYINSSRYEGLPFSILEAMASGLPVIASAVDGNKEVIQHDHGILVHPGDQGKMVEAIMSLVEDESKRKSLGNSGREFVARYFSLSGMMSKTEQVYLSAASN